MEPKRETIEWNMKDILSSTRVNNMSLAEEGAYRRALDYFWKDGYLPNDVNMIAKIIGKDCTLEIATVVKSMFTVSSRFPGQLTHDYVQKLAEPAPGNPYTGAPLKMIADPVWADQEERDHFKTLVDRIYQDEHWVSNVCGMYKMTENEVFEACEKFKAIKLGTSEFKKILNHEILIKNLFYFMPYAKNNQDRPRSSQNGGSTTRATRSEERSDSFRSW